ncbi:type II toxin-antitoxin system VapC family toxin [Saccharomonospora xinjiangensis]|uniref:type II toxin-antitoxin system VapC family toxin n=1 Tax=Saccharomonospora xinjiangensis TaxID=75294 RepID=UPI00106F40DE|nr:type II toxin-antitoxin system VapC family toxin [Saccharomonospora xinjiangensis]QBQ59128.1 Ribonuclease VapC3 [Saccharomonospora xinjiangensis]
MSEAPGAGEIVIDASVVVDILAGTPNGDAARDRIRHAILHAPAHIDAEVLSALSRLQRAGVLDTSAVSHALTSLVHLPVRRHELPKLAPGAWSRRENVRVADALYVELASQLGVTLVTTDQRLARACHLAESVTEPPA